MLDNAANLAGSVDVWDPTLNDGYQNLSCDINDDSYAGPDVILSPFQGFWVRTTDENPSLQIAQEAYQPFNSAPKKHEQKLAEPFTMNLTHENEGFAGRKNLVFFPHGLPELDAIDAPKFHCRYAIWPGAMWLRS